MRELDDEGIVLGGGLSVSDLTDARGRLARVRVEGRIRCAFGASVYADTRLEARTRRDGRTEVRGVDYTYHAWRDAGSERRVLFRYDMAHGGLHLHLPDPATGEETGRTPVPLEALPDLDRLLRYAVALAARERPAARGAG